MNFCSTCGAKLVENKKKTLTLDIIIGFYVSIIVYFGVSYYIYDNYPNNLFAEIIAESLFATLVLVFSFFNYNELIKLYKFPKLDQWILLFILLTFINAFIVHSGVEFMNKLIDLDTSSNNNYEEYIYLDSPLIWSILFVAILPPVFEELAFRGFLFNALTKFTSIKSTILATSFLFALIHLSAISIIWIFPFGIFLGYLRWKYNSLWIPMLVHFIHNITVLMIDYYTYTPIE